MHNYPRSDNAVDRVLNWAYEGKDQGSRYPGMSYEDGLAAGIEWITGQTDEDPSANE